MKNIKTLLVGLVTGISFLIIPTTAHAQTTYTYACPIAPNSFRNWASNIWANATLNTLFDLRRKDGKMVMYEHPTFGITVVMGDANSTIDIYNIDTATNTKRIKYGTTGNLRTFSLDKTGTVGTIGTPTPGGFDLYVNICGYTSNVGYITSAGHESEQIDPFFPSYQQQTPVFNAVLYDQAWSTHPQLSSSTIRTDAQIDSLVAKYIAWLIVILIIYTVAKQFRFRTTV